MEKKSLKKISTASSRPHQEKRVDFSIELTEMEVGWLRKNLIVVCTRWRRGHGLQRVLDQLKLFPTPNYDIKYASWKEQEEEELDRCQLHERD